MNLSSNDKVILRKLACEYMEAASLPTQREKLEQWKSFNRRDASRPMIIIDQLPWNELSPNNEMALHVSDPFFREIEWSLRGSLYRWRHFPVDMVLEPFITIPKAIKNTGYSLVAQDEVIGADDSTAKSHLYSDVLKTEDDIQKIKDMNITEDSVKSLDWLLSAKEVFDGIAPVIQGHGVSFSLGVWDRLSEYMGVENIYCDIYDRPEFLHACMRRITDSTIAGIKQANTLSLHNDIASTCHCSYVYTDELLPDFGKGLGATSQNSWSMGLAQLFSYVSPSVTEEFELPYITEMAKYFNSIYYGCCDRLDDRMDIVFKIPNVKKISCSPWSLKESFAEQLSGKPYIISAKPNPAHLSSSYDEELIRKDLRETMTIARKYNVNVELILKDISTVNDNPERLTRFAEIAMEEAASV